jgi:hypothetical protein
MTAESKINLKNEVKGIWWAGLKALILCVFAAAAGYFLLPRFMTMPTTIGDALIFTLRIDLFILLWVVIGVSLVSHARRQSTADIRGSAFGTPSESIRIKIAFLQNTLEQAFMAISSHLVLSTLVTGESLSFIVVAVGLFAMGRVTFYLGYPNGAAARAFGMFTTMIPTLFIVGYSMVALARNGLSP